MAHFAKLDSNNRVEDIVFVDNAVTANVSKIAMLAYRHIDFQRALDDGLDDEKLAKQQPLEH